MLTLTSLIDEHIASILPEMVAFRHQMHQQPEIGQHEVRTSAAIRERLVGTPVALWQPLLQTDVIGELKGASERTIVLRADIDAIPGEEESDVPYRTQAPGLMHACGHDGHTTMLLGAALVLSALREQLPVTVRFVFQPGEEMVCAGKDLVALGACEGAEAAYSLHAWHDLPVGVISSRPGAIFAAGGELHITVHGKGCHGAMPECGRNPIPVAARIVAALQALHATWQAKAGAVITVTAVQAGNSANVVPETATIRGTARYLSLDTAEEMAREMRAACEAIADDAGLSIDYSYTGAYDLPVLNTDAGYKRVRTVIERYFADGWREAERPTMAMEDFAFYLPGREGAMSFLGMGEEFPPLHNPRFNFNDDALANGIKFFCLLALSEDAGRL